MSKSKKKIQLLHLKNLLLFKIEKYEDILINNTVFTEVNHKSQSYIVFFLKPSKTFSVILDLTTIEKFYVHVIGENLKIV